MELDAGYYWILLDTGYWILSIEFKNWYGCCATQTPKHSNTQTLISAKVANSFAGGQAEGKIEGFLFMLSVLTNFNINNKKK